MTKELLEAKRQILYVAKRALESDYVDTIATYPEPRVIKTPAARLNPLRDNDIRAIIIQTEKEIEALENEIV